MARETHTRVETEAVLIENIIDLCKTASIIIVGSAAIITELRYIRDTEKRGNVLTFYKSATVELIRPTADILSRTQKLIAQGLGDFDAAHVALAEAAKADYVLTVDDDFERTASKLKLTVNVINPSNFLMEVIKWIQSLSM